MRHVITAMAVALMLPTTVPPAEAHCDSLDGPVVQAAQLALNSGDLSPVLKWVQPGDEPAISEAFERTIRVRSLGDEAQQLADRYFYETVVRVHRAGEGAPYTGLKQAGSAEPWIAQADAALESGDAKELLHDVTALVRDGVHERFMHVVASQKRAEESVALGRDFVASYVAFIHYVEAVHEAASHKQTHTTHSGPSDH